MHREPSSFTRTLSLSRITADRRSVQRTANIFGCRFLPFSSLPTTDLSIFDAMARSARPCRGGDPQTTDSVAAILYTVL